jgi:hypothetical protein
MKRKHRESSAFGSSGRGVFSDERIHRGAPQVNFYQPGTFSTDLCFWGVPSWSPQMLWGRGAAPGAPVFAGLRNKFTRHG